MADKSKGQAQLDSAARAATYNVALQVCLRISSFILNAFVLRHITGELLGVVNMRLTLLYDTLLFVSSEALRKACLSQTKQPSTWQQTVNLTWCSVPICVVASILLCTLWLSPLLEQPNVQWDPTAVVIFALCALLELLAEPLWVLAQAHHHTSLRVMAKGAGQLLKVVLVVLGTATWPQLGLLAFCAGQVASSVVYVLVYYVYFWRVMTRREAAKDLPVTSLRGMLPRLAEQDSFSQVQVGLGWSFFKQSFLKQLLTDGERYVMTLFGVLSFAQQGVYDVVNNLSSLVARFIFQPIEESFYVFFARTLLRGEPASRQPAESLDVAVTTLARLLKLVVVISLTILVFGYSYSHVALRVYGGALLADSEGPTLMRFFCAYVPLLALNGITECFFFALMSQAEVDRYNRKLLAFSAVFLCSALLLTRGFGSIGFVLANCVNMAVRIWQSCLFIQTFFANTNLHPFSSAVPARSLLAVLVGCALITATSEALVYDRTALHVWHALGHVLVGACCMVALLVAMAIAEEDLCYFLVERLPSRLQPLPLALLHRLHSH